MPEVFDHFFRLLGSTRGRASSSCSSSTPATGSCSSRRDGARRRSSTSRRTASANLALAERLEPGAGAKLSPPTSTPPAGSTRPRSGSSSTRRSRTCGRCSSGRSLRGLPRLVPMLADSLHRYVTRRFNDPPARADPAVPRRVPRQLALCHSGHVPPDEHARPRGRRALPARRHHRGHRRGPAAGRGSAAFEIRTGDRGGPHPHGRARRRGRRGDGCPHRGTATSCPPTWSSPRWISRRPSAACCRRRCAPTAPDWWAKRTPGPSAVLVLLGVRGALPELLHHTLLFTADWDARTSRR